jgi:hypothetical protein
MKGHCPRPPLWSASRSIVLALERFDVFLCPLLPGGPLRRTSMVVEFGAYGLEVRSWFLDNFRITNNCS